jgi:4-amino-4-deoxy-L-arabinose transferase-like glycosyltransferase
VKQYWLASAALVGLTALRLAIAALVPLAPDEAYYWVWSRALAPGYPDHPPMVALWIRLGTTLAGNGTLGVRLLAPLAMAVASLLLADAAARLLGRRCAGWCAAALLNATPLFGVGGVLITPDAPLLAFWTGCLWALARLLDSADQRWWFAVGLLAGLAMVSKYTAALLWFGIGTWLLVTPSMRPWLRRPAPWLGALLGITVFLPVLCWDASHGWASFLRQGGRIGVWDPSQAMRFLGELLGGQIGLVSPLIFAFCIGGIVKAVKQGWRTRNPAWTLLALLALPGVAVFVEHALGDRVQGNWPAIIYPAAGVAGAGLQGPLWRRLTGPALGLGFGLSLLLYAQATLWLVPLPAERDPVAGQLAGWVALAAQVDQVRQQTGARFVAADQYGLAAELARTLPDNVIVLGGGMRWTQTGLPRADLAGEPGILVRRARAGEEPNEMLWSDATGITQLARRLGNRTIERFRLDRVVARPGAVVVTLPRP